MKKFILLAWFVLSSFLQAAETTPIDSNRPFLDKLRSRDSVRYTDFIYPFLLAQTGAAADVPAQEMAGKLRAFLEKGKLSLASHFSSVKGTPSIELPDLVRTGKQLEGIQECKEDKCQMKLHTQREKKAMEASLDKLKTFNELLDKRLENYHKKRELLGYEDREDDREYVKKMLQEFPFFSSRYPEISKFFAEDFWKGEGPAKGFVSTMMKQEVVNLAPDRMQPIWRVAELFEFKVGGGWVFFEVHVYSNHYLDSSVRIFEVFPLEKRSLLIMTDIMEIDELTKSGLIRMLYKGKMEEAVIEAQAQDIKSILK